MSVHVQFYVIYVCRSMADSDNLLLLVATQNGVFRSRINGSSAAMVGGSSSVESNGAWVYHCTCTYECVT